MTRPIIPTLETPAVITKLASDCLSYLAAIGHASSTIDGYDRAVKQFVAFILNKGLSDDIRHFTGDNVVAWVQALHGQQIKPRTILGKLSGLSTIAEFALRQPGRRGKPLLVANPVKTFRWPKKVQAEKRLIYRDELQAFMGVERPLNETVARALLITTGLRASEACNASVGDLTDTGQGVFVSVIVKGGHRRDVPVPRAVADLIRDYLLSRKLPGPNAPLLLNSRGERYRRTALTELMARIGKAAGVSRLRVSSHRLRHTSNYLAKVGGVDIHTRSRLLTHMGLRAQMEYEHDLPIELSEARERQYEALQKWLDRDSGSCQMPQQLPLK